MEYILGLDLGTNSIGWAIVDEDNEKIIDAGVRIFPIGVKLDNGVESSKAAERTGFRSARRLKFRRKIRKYNTLKVLIENNMCPLSLEELHNWKQYKIYPKDKKFFKWLQSTSDLNPYYYRNLVSLEKLDKDNEQQQFMLGRAFYHLAQRRGFKSNRLEQNEDTNKIEDYKPTWNEIVEKSKNITELILNFDDYLSTEETEFKDVNAVLVKLKKQIAYLRKAKNEGFDIEKEKFLKIINKKVKLGVVAQSIKDLSENIKNANCDTLGQYFYLKNKENEKVRNNYTHREEHYEKEFKIICDKQNLDSKIVDELRKAIFFQRPLRSQKGLVAKCTFETNKARSPVSHPLFEIYRMLGFINNIKYKIEDKNIEKDSCKNNNCKNLSDKQKNVIVDLFFRKSKTQFKFEDIKKALVKYEKKKLVFNYPDYTTVSGCPMVAALKILFINKNDWKKFSFSDKINFYKKIKLPNIKTKKEEHLFAVWHVLFTYEDTNKIVEFATQKLKLENTIANRLSTINCKQGYANLSIKAIKKINVFLEQGYIFTHSVFLANIQEVVGNKVWKNNNLKTEIINGIINIIDKHRFETNRITAINSLLKTCHNKNETYSKQAEQYLKNDIENNLKREIGMQTWKNTENKTELINKSFAEFVDLLTDGELQRKRLFKKIKRTDEKIKDFLIGKNKTGEIYCNNSDKLNKLYHPSDVEMYKEAKISKDGKRYLQSPRTESVKNPVAMKSLHQLRHLINSLIKDGIVDETMQVNIELAREMNDANVRKAIESWQKKRETENKEYKKILIQLFKEQNKKETPKQNDIDKIRIWSEQIEDRKTIDSLLNPKVKKTDIEKYRLWTEQKGVCPYTGDQIPIHKLFDGISYDIEHTIPRSLSYDNSMENKTIAQSRFNRDIKKQRIPFELENNATVLLRIDNWKKKYEDINKLIEQKVKASRAAQTKDIKDSAIQERHKLTFERNYWRNKYNRFTMKEVKAGFKNSQLNDTRLITKFARAYIKTVFSRVHTVNGKSTAWIKERWGLDKKDRANHIHHAQDAVVVACLVKKRTTEMETYFKKAETENMKEPKIPKPWNSFFKDVNDMQNQTLIYHHTDDNITKQTKKKVRKRGIVEPKIIYKKNKNGDFIYDKNNKKIIEKYVLEEKNGQKIPIFGKQLFENEIKNKKEGKHYFKIKTKNAVKYYQYVRYQKNENGNKKGEIVYKKAAKMIEGTTFRNAIHQETFYGAIKQTLKDKDGKILRDENNEMKYLVDKNNEPIINFVVRRKLDSLKKNEVEKIVDNTVKDIIEKAIEDKIFIIHEKKANVLKQTIWMNKEKKIPINKVRVRINKNPMKPTNQLAIKKHRDESKASHKYKEYIYATTAGNYCLALYQNSSSEKTKREVIPYNYQQISEYIRNFNKNKKEGEQTKQLIDVKHVYKNIPFFCLLKKGMFVLFYEQNPNEIEWDNKKDLVKRLYKITEILGNGNIKLKFHQESRNDKKIEEDFTKLYGKEWFDENKTIKTGKSKFEYNKNYPKLNISKTNYNFLIEGKDFVFKQNGEIEKFN